MDATDAVVLGWAPDGPTLRLDHRRFSYAGKFVMSTTGKAVLLEPTDGADGTDALESVITDGAVESASLPTGEVVAAAAFNADRTDDGRLWLRYVSVRADRRGQGYGPWLCSFVVDRAAERGFEHVRIAVNNPFAYEALYRAGFAFVGRETGIAELVLERPTDESAPTSDDRYQDGLDRFRERALSDAERAFLADRRDASPPPPTG